MRNNKHMKIHDLNIPTYLTLFRLVLSPFFLPFLFVYVLPYNNLFVTYFVASFFVFLSFTDFLDGYLARKYKQETALGRALDPIADKFLLFSALISLVALHKMYFYWAIIFIGREFFIMGLRIVALENNIKVHVSWLGKLKTIAQIAYITMVIVDASYSSLALSVALFLSLVSAYFYYASFIEQFTQKKFHSIG